MGKNTIYEKILAYLIAKEYKPCYKIRFKEESTYYLGRPEVLYVFW